MGTGRVIAVGLLLAITGVVRIPLAGAQDHTIKLDILVRDASDKPVNGLTAQDLTVSDNGSTQQLTAFAEVNREIPPPLVVLVFDLINTRATESIQLRGQLVKTLQRDNGRLPFPTLLMFVTKSGISSTEKPTVDGNALAKALMHVAIGPNMLEDLSGPAGVMQRMNASIKALAGVMASVNGLPRRKLILWMSHGWDWLGGLPLSPDQEREMFAAIQERSTAYRKSRATLYSLDTDGQESSVEESQAYRQYLKGVNTLRDADYADLSLEVLATQSGGLVLNSNDFAAMFDRCLTDAGEHYEVEIPETADSRKTPFHAVQVKVNRRGAVARTRNGYYSAVP